MNNKAIIEFGFKNSADLGGYYPPRPSASVDNSLLVLQNSSYPTQPHSMKPWSQGWLIAAGAYPGFCNMKRLEVLQVTPP